MQMNENQKLREAFEQGWKMAAEWSFSDHLLADVESPTYLKERDWRLQALALPTAEQVGELPELPEPFALSVSVHEGDTPAKTYVECQLFQKHPNEKQKLYTADQMRAYAREAMRKDKP